jgi:hypothetical protein
MESDDHGDHECSKEHDGARCRNHSGQPGRAFVRIELLAASAVTRPTRALALFRIEVATDLATLLFEHRRPDHIDHQLLAHSGALEDTCPFGHHVPWPIHTQGRANLLRGVDN